jgi:hypothetical protein
MSRSGVLSCDLLQPNAELHSGFPLPVQEGNISECSCAFGRIDLEWARGRVFDQDVAQLFQLLVKEARTMRCTAVAAKEGRRQRPDGELMPCLCQLRFAFCTWQTLVSLLFWHYSQSPILEMAH